MLLWTTKSLPVQLPSVPHATDAKASTGICGSDRQMLQECCFRLDVFWCRIIAAPPVLIQAREIIGIIIYNCAISENCISVTVVIDLEKGYKLT